MSLNETPVANRLHIAIFGRRNAGKSSLINALTAQQVALVSPVAGTTTDPVFKTMELLPLGPVVLIDTAGLDDAGDLGQMRVAQSLRVLEKTELALIVIEPELGVTDQDLELLQRTKEKKIPTLVVLNKIDLNPSNEAITQWSSQLGCKLIRVSALAGTGIEELKHQIILQAPQENNSARIVADLINPGDLVVLVIPIDKAAPKGRLILPQQQTIRDILEADAMAVVTKEHELQETLAALGKKPALVITDSQAFLKVCADTPADIPLTSFSILFARFKGELLPLLQGVQALKELKRQSRILIVEGCTHHRQADDIGKVKIPRWLRQIAGGELEFHWSAGAFLPQDLDSYDLIVHCGACMLNSQEMKYRLHCCQEKGVPMVNYGMLIAYVHGVLERALSPFPYLKDWNIN